MQLLRCLFVGQACTSPFLAKEGPQGAEDLGFAQGGLLPFQDRKAAGFDSPPSQAFAGVKKGAGWRSGEGTRMISAIMQKRITSLFYWSSARFAKRVIKDVITRKTRWGEWIGL